MGCTSSREARLDGQAAGLRRRSYSMPIRSSFSGPLFKRNLDSGHLHQHAPKLASFNDIPDTIVAEEMMMKSVNDRPVPAETLSKELLKAKAWSHIVPSSIAKTPTVTPPNEPEVINAWELMEGLEDADSPLFLSAPRSFSFNATRPKISQPSLDHLEENSSTKPQWMHSNVQDCVISDFDPEILSSFRMALEDPSPQHPSFIRVSPELEKITYHTRSLSVEAGDVWEDSKASGNVKAMIRDFQQKIDAKRAKSKFSAAKIVSCYESPPDSKRKVVFYFTSIRGVRKTYEDCWAMKLILKGYGVCLDERDVSMHSGFKDELNEILGPSFGGHSLPRIFADGNYLGGADELRQLHEIGELGKFLENCDKIGKGGIELACEGCADVRFIPCENCSGSCKVYIEEDYEDVEEQEEIGSFQRCPDCNENGLVRCPLCC